jgi:hypothetical protein
VPQEGNTRAEERRGRSCANTDERHEMHGEGKWT